MAVMLAFIFAIGLIPSTAGIPAPSRGSDLYHDCQANLKIMYFPSSSRSEVGRAMACQAYISGFLDGLRMSDNKLVCADAATIGTATRIYVGFMERNLTFMDEPKMSGLYQALAVGYPCPASPSPKEHSEHQP